MSGLESEIAAPALLAATPQVVDPHFERAVVLLLYHTEQGSFGFNLNRPTEVSVAEILAGLEIAWAGDPSSTAFLGGPVQPQLGTVLFESRPGAPLPLATMAQTTTEVLPGLRMTQHIDDLSCLAQSPPAGFRLYLGYAGWGTGQLLEEILRNDWIVAPVLDESVFAAESDQLWRRVLREVGVDPDALASWTPASGDSRAN